MSQKAWLRRQALQIAAQLPENPDDARAVLAEVGKLVQFFFEPPGRPLDQAVLRFPGGPSSPKRRAKSKGNPSDLPK